MNTLNIFEILFFCLLFFYVKTLCIYFIQSVHIDKLDNFKRRAIVTDYIEKQRAKGIKVYEKNDDIFESTL